MGQKKLVIIALACGLLAAALAFVYLRKQQNSFGSMRIYLAAQTRISKGDKFAERSFTVKQIPASFAPANGVRPSDRSNVVGTKAAVDIAPGQIVLWDYVESGLEANRLSDLLAKGERALTLSVNAISGLEGMIRPNDRVDILGTFTVSAERTVTRILDQNVTVLAVGQRFGNSSSGGYQSVTVKVTPAEAEILTFAESHGHLRLVLRNRSDLEINSELPEVDFGNILAEERRATTWKASLRPRVVYQ